jgi:hypothetical protein
MGEAVVGEAEPALAEVRVLVADEQVGPLTHHP